MYAGNIINNDIVPSPTTRHSIDPATGSALYEVPVARQEARRALKSWSTTPCSGHAKLLLKYADLLEENRDEMERLLTLEQGRPLSLSSTEVTCALVWLRAFATMEIEDEVLQDDDEKTIYSTHPPIGVCAGIVSELVSNCS
jgi:acyl-CoA reductase-like NAD-dependent aldehyde dehydrogenase